MIIEYNNNLYETNKFYFNADAIVIDKIIKVSKKDNINLILKNGEKFNLLKLIFYIKEIGYNESLFFLIIDNYMNVHVEYEQSVESMEFKKIEIVFGADIAEEFTEEDLVAFLSHEIGHLMDSKTEIVLENRLILLKKISYLIILSFVIYNYYIIKLNILSIIFSLILGFLILLITKYHSRKLEYNADVFAVKVLGNYQKVISAYKRLEEFSPTNEKSGILSTHPNMQDRILYLKRRYWYIRLYNFIFSTRN